MRQPPENSLVARPEIRPFEPEAQQRLLDVRVAGLAAEDMIVVLRVVQTVQELFVFGAFVVGALGDLARQGLDPRPRAATPSSKALAVSSASVVVSATHIVCGRYPIVQSPLSVTAPDVGCCSPVMMRQERGYARSVLAHQSECGPSGLIRNEIMSKRVQPP